MKLSTNALKKIIVDLQERVGFPRETAEMMIEPFQDSDHDQLMGMFIDLKKQVLIIEEAKIMDSLIQYMEAPDGEIESDS